MLKIILKSVLQLAVVLIGISTLLFILLRLSGDPAAMIAGPEATNEQLEIIRKELGLDRPIAVQYFSFIFDMMRFEFGNSFRTGLPVWNVILERLPNSLILAAVAVVLAMSVAIPVGVYIAVNRNKASSFFALSGSLIGQSIPNFVLGIFLLLIFAAGLGWFPSYGFSSPLSLVLPAITLSSFMMARHIRLTRSFMVEELQKDYVRTANANGIPQRKIRYKHVLRNVIAPVFSLAAIDLGQLFGGAVITETVFSWPGLGRLLVDNVLHRDYPVVQASVFMIAVIVVAVNFAMNILNRRIDPTLRRVS